MRVLLRTRLKPHGRAGGRVIVDRLPADALGRAQTGEPAALSLIFYHAFNPIAAGGGFAGAAVAAARAAYVAGFGSTSIMMPSAFRVVYSSASAAVGWARTTRSHPG